MNYTKRLLLTAANEDDAGKAVDFFTSLFRQEPKIDKDSRQFKDKSSPDGAVYWKVSKPGTGLVLKVTLYLSYKELSVFVEPDNTKTRNILLDIFPDETFVEAKNADSLINRFKKEAAIREDLIGKMHDTAKLLTKK